MPQALRDPIVYAIPAFVLLLLLEMFAMYRLDEEEKKNYAGYEKQDAVASITAGFGSLFVTGGTRLVALVGYAALYAVTPLRWDTHRWYMWVVAVLLVDFVFYWTHRTSHRVRIGWAAHQAHHNSQYFNLSTALRQKWNPWFELLFWVPLPLLGMPPWMIFTAYSFNLMYQFWVHTERIHMLPAPIEFVFNTPSHHRVHHGSDPEYLDRNYAGIFIVWDRLFGSYAHETHRPTYGLTKNIDSFKQRTIQYHEYRALFRDVRAARRWRDKLGYVFAPPGWKPVADTVEAEVTASVS